MRRITANYLGGGGRLPEKEGVVWRWGASP